MIAVLQHAGRSAAWCRVCFKVLYQSQVLVRAKFQFGVFNLFTIPCTWWVSFLFVSFRSPSLFYLLVHSRCRGFLFSLDHTQTHTTVGRTPLDEGSARHRDLYLTTQTLYKTNNPAPGDIRTHDPSKRLAEDLSLRPRGHWATWWVIFKKNTVKIDL
jgi:hypothetical protein